MYARYSSQDLKRGGNLEITKRSLPQRMVRRDKLTLGGKSIAGEVLHAVDGQNTKWLSVPSQNVETALKEFLAFSNNSLRNKKGLSSETVLFLETLFEHITRVTSVKCLCHGAGINRKELYRVFSKELHQTPYCFFRGVRVLAAMHIMSRQSKECTTISLKELSRLLGFGSYAPFRRAFHQTVGLSPRGFQQHTRKRDILSRLVVHYLVRAKNNVPSHSRRLFSQTKSLKPSSAFSIHAPVLLLYSFGEMWFLL